MNGVTRDIMALLGVDVELALKVQDEMIAGGFDFSECTARAFRREAKLCLLVVTVYNGTPQPQES